MRLQALLLDIDGTLIDTNEQHTDCWLAAFEHFGKRIDRTVIREQIGKGGDLLVPDTLNAREMRDIGGKVKTYRGKLWKERYLDSVAAFPGAVDTVRALHGRGITIALASSSSAEEVEAYVKLLGIGDLLEATTSQKDAEMSKPSPEIFEAALERIGADAERTAVVGDTPYDILAAHRIPLPVIAVRTGGFPPETLAKAEFLFDDMPAMLREIDRIDDYFRH